MAALATFNTALSTFYCSTPLLPPLYSTAVMGRGLREVAADVVCTLGMEEDEGKIDALAVSLEKTQTTSFNFSILIVVFLYKKKKDWEYSEVWYNLHNCNL